MYGDMAAFSLELDVILRTVNPDIAGGAGDFLPRPTPSIVCSSAKDDGAARSVRLLASNAIFNISTSFTKAMYGDY